MCHTQWRDGYFDFSIVIYKGDRWQRDVAPGCHKKYCVFGADLFRVAYFLRQRDLLES